MIASHRTLLWGQAAGGLAVNFFLNGAVPINNKMHFPTLKLLSEGCFLGGRCWDSVPIGRGGCPSFRSAPKTPIGAL